MPNIFLRPAARAGTSSGGTTDHGALSGLFDNDHPQYALTADTTILESSLTAHTANTSVHFTVASIDHGLLAGLTDDDHAQYHTDLRAEIWISGGTGDGVSAVKFDTAGNYEVALTEGMMQWNKTDNTLELGLPGSAVLQIGQETLLRIRNNTGQQLVDGQIVYVNGSTGNIPTVTLAIANATAATSASCACAIITEPIDNNSVGFATVYGTVRNLNTMAYSEGDQLFVSSGAAGQFTNVAPNAPHRSVPIGVVTNAHASQGSILFYPRQAYTLRSLADVDGVMPDATNRFLVYDADASVWNASPIPFSAITDTAHTHTQYALTSDTALTNTQFTAHTADTSIHFTVDTIDHGSIAGLYDNDHPQYRLTGTPISLSGDLAQEGAVEGNAMVWDGAKWVPSGVTAQINGGVIEQSYGIVWAGSSGVQGYSSNGVVANALSLPANIATANRILHIKASGRGGTGSGSGSGQSVYLTLPGADFAFLLKELTTSGQDWWAEIFITIDGPTTARIDYVFIEHEDSEVIEGESNLTNSSWNDPNIDFSISGNVGFAISGYTAGGGWVGVIQAEIIEQGTWSSNDALVVFDTFSANTLTVDQLIVNGQEFNASGSPVSDHGALTGLFDNDHPQYAFTSTTLELESSLTAHTADTTIHFTVASIDHGSITGLFDNDHPQYRQTGVTISLSGDLAQEGATLGQVITWDGAKWIASGVTAGGSPGSSTITGSTDFSGSPVDRQGIIYKASTGKYQSTPTLFEQWGGSGMTAIAAPGVSGASRCWIPAGALSNVGDTLVVEANFRSAGAGAVWQFSLNGKPITNTSPSFTGFIAPAAFAVTEVRLALQRSGSTGGVMSLQVYEEGKFPNGYAGFIITSGFDWNIEQTLDLNVMNASANSDVFYMRAYKVQQTYRGT